jgi:hypothetical protein
MTVWYRALGEGVGGIGENYARGLHDFRRYNTKFPAKIAPSAGTSSVLLNLKLHKFLLNKTLNYSIVSFATTLN